MAMDNIFTAAKEKVIIYWLLGFYVVLFSASSLASCLLASLIGATWAQLDTQGKIMIGLAVFGNWSAIMLALMNKAATKITKDQLPISPDDADLIPKPTKQTLTQTTQTTSVVETSTPTQPDAAKV